MTQCLALCPTPLLSGLGPSVSSDPQFHDEDKGADASSQEVQEGQG